MGWGRLIFADSFKKASELAKMLCQEKKGERDIVMNSKHPHITISKAPHEIFVDPSYVMRLDLEKADQIKIDTNNFIIDEIRKKSDIDIINAIYKARHMSPIEPVSAWKDRKSKKLMQILVRDKKTGEPIGTAAGVDHQLIYNDPRKGASIWGVAVDPQATYPKIGIALLAYFINYYKKKGRRYFYLSVMSKNNEAMALYRMLGFKRVQRFCLKHKNPANEALFTPPTSDEDLNPYSKEIIKAARKRGILVETIDKEKDYYSLTLGGKKIICRESLSDMTSAVAMSICRDYSVSNRLLKDAGLSVPEQIIADDEKEIRAFLRKNKNLVVKPADIEKREGITTEIKKFSDLTSAIKKAKKYSEEVVIEKLATGKHVRVLVINNEVVAAGLRESPKITGTGKHKIRELINKLNRRRIAATKGESIVPFDDETKECIAHYGYNMDDILPAKRTIKVRFNTNIRTGGTMKDVTDKVSQRIKDAALAASYAIDIPVLGVDFVVPKVDSRSYCIIKTLWNIGFAHFDPQPAVEKFLDMLFPQTVPDKEYQIEPKK